MLLCAQALSLLCLGLPGGGAGAEPAPTGVAPATVAAYAAGTQALLAHEAALQRGTAAIRCIRISVVLCLSHAQRVMCRLLLAANRFKSMCLRCCLLTIEVKGIGC